MKKLILASTIAALSLSAAHAGTTVYGKAGIGINYTDAGDGQISLDEDSTRIGFKGGEKITANTTAIYQLEYALATDEQTLALASRDTFVGFENAELGTLKAGRLTSIDDNADKSNPSKNGGTDASVNEGRWDNSLVYSTPDMGGLQIMAQYAVNDTIDNTDNTDPILKVTEGSFGLAGSYSTGAVEAGASFISVKDKASAMRVSAALAVSPVVKVSGLYQITDFDTDGSEKENAITVAATYDLANTPWDVFAQIDMTDNKGGVDKTESSHITAGANYTFTQATTGHVYFGIKEANDNDTFGLGASIVHAF